MGRLVFAAVLGAIAFSVLLAAALLRSQRPGPIVSLLRFGGLGLGALALALAVGSTMVVIDPRGAVADPQRSDRADRRALERADGDDRRSLDPLADRPPAITQDLHRDR